MERACLLPKHNKLKVRQYLSSEGGAVFALLSLLAPPTAARRSAVTGRQSFRMPISTGAGTRTPRRLLARLRRPVPLVRFLALVFRRLLRLAFALGLWRRGSHLVCTILGASQGSRRQVGFATS